MVFSYSNPWWSRIFGLLNLPLSMTRFTRMVVVIFAALSFCRLQATESSFLGWIPVQTLSGGKVSEFDLTRSLSLS